MNMIEIIKEKTLWLIGAVLITIPLLACYPILKFLGLSSKIATIVTACLSGVAYILLVTYIQPFLGKILPFMHPKTENKFSVVKHKANTRGKHVEQGLLYPGVLESNFDLSNFYALREHSGNWTHS